MNWKTTKRTRGPERRPHAVRSQRLGVPRGAAATAARPLNALAAAPPFLHFRLPLALAAGPRRRSVFLSLIVWYIGIGITYIWAALTMWWCGYSRYIYTRARVITSALYISIYTALFGVSVPIYYWDRALINCESNVDYLISTFWKSTHTKSIQ